MIRVHPDAATDLRNIRTVDQVAFGRLLALIEQLKVDADLASNLRVHDYGKDHSAPFSVKRWQNVWHQDHTEIWRLKSWELADDNFHYRLVYYVGTNSVVTILAVVRRSDIDYDNPAHPVRSRVLDRVRRELSRR